MIKKTIFVLIVLLAIYVFANLFYHVADYWLSYPETTSLTIELSISDSSRIIILERIDQKQKPIIGISDAEGKVHFTNLPTGSEWEISLAEFNLKRKLMRYKIPKGTLNHKISLSLPQKKS